MAWKKRKQLIKEGFRDLEYLPRGPHRWHSTLAALAYGGQPTIGRRPPDLNAWAARHCTSPSARYDALGARALVLWHGTTRTRADRIAEHGLFHKRGLWTALDPSIAHGYCRRGAERFDTEASGGNGAADSTEGALVSLVLDRAEFVQGRDYNTEMDGRILRFHHGLPPDVVEYVLVREAIRFTGLHHAPQPAPWPQARFRRHEGAWVPLQRAPVRYSESKSYSSLHELILLCLDRFLAEDGEVTALDLFSALYAAVTPWDALPHQAVFDVLEARCQPHRQHRSGQTFRGRLPADVA